MADASEPEQVLLAQRLRDRARATPERIAYTFLRENGSEQDICYAELSARVDALAAHMLAHAGPGDRALLLCPAGIDFLVAFFACLAAGIVAVPAAPAHRERDAARLAALLEDAAPALVLCAPEAHAASAAALARAGCRVPLLHGPAGEGAVSLPAPAPAAVAFLQYTSGSTGQPKGVEVTHANIAANVAAIGSAFGFGADTVMVSWLPPFHDMGLIGSIAAPLMLGFRSVLMAPGTFLRRPAAWLEAITRYRATCSGGPNFAWELCLRRIGDAHRTGLDLASLDVLYNGAEPVRAATLERFMQAFGACGLRREALFPCYGMAEATLLVAGGPRGRAPRMLALDAAAIERGEVCPTGPGQAGSRLLVSCGPAAPGAAVAVVDPARCVAAGADRIGELWIAGAGVARGYHGRTRDSARLFDLRIADAPASLGGARWLRSGDLGFVRDGEVYVTGRCKDVIVINGRKIHAQDVEELAEGVAAALAPNSCAAFALEGEGGERLALAVEATRALVRAGGLDELARTVRAAVTAGTGVALHTLVFVAPGAFPRTTSGKVQRARCKALLEEGALPLLALRPVLDSGSRARADAAIAWLRSYAPRRLDSRLADERRSLAPHVLPDFGLRGLLGLQAPAASGGLALATRDLVRVMAQLAALDLTLATLVGVHNGLGLRPLLRFAPEPLRAQWLPLLASGRQLAAFALSEPQAGSNPRAIGTRADRVDGGWRLNGEKHLIGLAAWAGVLTVFARAFDTAGRALGTVALLVPGDAPGLHLGPEALTMGMRAMPQSAVRFDGVFVADAQVLGTPGAGMDVAQDAMGFARLGIGALCVGAMKRCFQLMARYAARRDIAGGRLLENPVTLLRLHELDCAIQAAESLVEMLASSTDAGEPLPLEACSACKCVLSELLWEAVDRLMQMLGGRGYLETNLAPQLLRDARVLRILEGPSEALYAHLGALLRVPGNPLAQAIERFGGGGYPAWPAQGSTGWQDARNGEFAAWTLLAATARGESSAWAARRLDVLRHAIGAESAAAGACPAGATLAARIAEYALAIGDIEQSAPGEAGGLDPLLRQAAPAAFVPEAPTPAAPSSLELVRACVARWLREGALGDTLPSGMPPLDVEAGAVKGVHAWTDDMPDVDIAREAVPVIDAWTVDTPFSDLGIDSLASVPLALEIEGASGVPVSAELLYDYPTVRALAAYIDAQRDEQRDERRDGQPVERRMEFE
ncbi:AMP-binding protein [Massilia litorea]|uniref:AMP-binding protein n=1 Tax=Massilia litorea TaxID=2769491 RepID=A0A7L9U1X9_9BURK|nr:AMP-binding protein [Massilia litorea]QOL48096.1 AMP-binding protein [Massilia litorea]